MIAKVGPKGQIVIPKQLRDGMGVRPGSTVSLRWRPKDGVVELSKAWDDPIADAPAYIQSLMRPDARERSATEDLLAMRREDNEIDEREYARWAGKASSSTRSHS